MVHMNKTNNKWHNVTAANRLDGNKSIPNNPNGKTLGKYHNKIMNWEPHGNTMSSLKQKKKKIKNKPKIHWVGKITATPQSATETEKKK